MSDKVKLRNYGNVSESARFVDLFQNLPDPSFLVVPEDFTIIEHNESAKKVFMRSEESLVGKYFCSIFRNSDWEPLDRELRATLSGHSCKPMLYEYVYYQTSQYFRVQAFRLDLDDGSYVVQLILRDFTDDKMLKSRIAHIIVDLENANHRLEQISITDEMTGAYNHRYFLMQAKQEHERAIRHGRFYSLIFIDIDHFKHYNDRNGHPAGDEALRLFAKALRDCLRSSDVLARYGGEEFVILCTDTDEIQAGIVVNRIHEKILGTDFPHGKSQPLGKFSASIGVASFPLDGNKPEEVVNAADSAMYISKKLGRCRWTQATNSRKKTA